MSETNEAGKKGGWFKALLGTAAGLCSGAFMMYLSPLIDRVIKPSKPVANFAVELQDLTATFHNRSTGSSQGWWDFGDGSPLEPLDPKQDTLTHTYKAPGNYTAKLSIRSLFGEDNERSVAVNLDQPKREPPAILAFAVDSASPGAFAPAAFVIRSQVKNADLCVLDLGEDKPLEFFEDANKQERYVTFTKPGGYVIKMAAVSGKQAVEKSEVVWVNEPDKGTCAVVLNVVDTATRVEATEFAETVAESFPPQSKDATHKINRVLHPRAGFEIMSAKVEPVMGPAARNLQVKVAADRKSCQLVGEMTRPTGGKVGSQGTGDTMVVKVLLTQERRTRVNRSPVAMTATVAVPGSTMISLPPLPDGWVDAQRQVRLELRDGERVLWQDSQMPHGVPVVVQNHRCAISATPVGNQVKVDLVEMRGQVPAAN